jgi:predicted TIM-barrel fold metal-dependent hydrolase
VAAPGVHRPWMDGRVPRTEVVVEPIDTSAFPPMTQREPRLALLDDQGLAAAVMLPTLAVCVEHELHDDPAASAANLRAFNRWIEDDWGYAHGGRLFAVPMLSLLDVAFAVEELERVLALGARAVHLKPGPVYGRSPADPAFDGFWARAAEAGIPVVFHTGDTGYHELYASQWGEPPRSPTHRTSMLQHAIAGVDRAASDTIAALILHNLFGRFPTLSVATVELGASWVPALVDHLDKAFRSAGHRATLGGALTDHPVELLRRHVHVCPFPEDDVAALVGLVGVERVLFGSDWPHPEGLPEPLDFVGLLDGLTEADRQAVLRGNASRLLRLS